MDNQNQQNEIQQTPVSNTLPPLKNKSFFSSKLFLVIFVLVLIGASSGTTYYFMGVNKENTPIVVNPTAMPTQTIQPTPTTKPTQGITPTIQITQPAAANSDNKPLLTAATNACESYIYKDVNKCLNPSIEDQKDIYGLVRISDMRILMKKDGNDWKFSTASSITDNPDFCSTGSGSTDLIKYCNIR